MGKSRLPPKKDVALALLESSSVFVHLDPRADGVTVPPWFKKQPQLVLQIGLNMPVPIPDLSLDGDGVSCTLSFNRSPQFCNVPWKAIYALVGEDGRGMVWPDDVPPEVAAQTRVVAAEGSKPKRKKKAHLRAVDDQGGIPSKSDEAPSSEPGEASDLPSADEAPDPHAPRAIESKAGAPPSNSVTTSDDDGESAPSSKKKLPPYLRVVK